MPHAHEFGCDLEKCARSYSDIETNRYRSKSRRKDFRQSRRRSANFWLFKQLEKNLAGGGRGRIDVDQIAVARVARMMIDVDPEFRAANSGEGSAEPILRRGIERDADVKIFRLARRRGQ